MEDLEGFKEIASGILEEVKNSPLASLAEGNLPSSDDGAEEAPPKRKRGRPRKQA